MQDTLGNAGKGPSRLAALSDPPAQPFPAKLSLSEPRNGNILRMLATYSTHQFQAKICVYSWRRQLSQEARRCYDGKQLNYGSDLFRVS
jgi:hypothetical protein